MAPDLLRRAAERLGIADPRNPGEWLLRLLVLSPSERPAWPRWIGRLHALLHSLLAAARRSASWSLKLPFRGVAASGRAVLDRIDHQRLDWVLEARAGRALQWPDGVKKIAAIAAVIGFALAVNTPLDWTQQLMLFLLLWALAMLVRRMPGHVASLLLIGFSVVASARYVWWRVTQTLEFDSAFEALLGYGLMLAEGYTWLILLLGYVQNAFPLGRPMVPMPADRAHWPTVDVFIPTYNEPASVVKPTLYAALGLDWPRDKLRVHLLDDGRRPEFRELAQAAGAHYRIRPNNFHAKAGNLNHALKQTDGDFVAIFDCDHVPVRSFLTHTLGWFLRDPKCAMVQTPHHFFSPDPFERNLGTFRRLPNEGALFYGLVQDGNDFWNASFFCGSCAVLRRGPLMEVGGIAVETVTEDAHTALKLHRRGYSTAYLSEVQAAGLSTESLSGHVGQRIRWARGMAQIFRIDNPFFGPGLNLFQRLCYGNAMLHFFNGLPRLVFLTSPLAFLYLHLHVIQAAALSIAAYALPHLVLAQICNSRMQGRYRHSFWAEVYESVLAWYIALPTTMALINPKLGKFNVTAKGGLVEDRYFDFRIARPYLALIGLNLIGVGLGLHYLWIGAGVETGTVVMNLVWAVYNLTILGTAASVALETRQVRRAHRIPLRVPVRLCLDDGRSFDCHTTDYSTTGASIEVPGLPALPRGHAIWLELPDHASVLPLPAQVVQVEGDLARLHFGRLSQQQEMGWIQTTFGRPDAWRHWREMGERDRPLSSLGLVLQLGLAGYARLLRELLGRLNSTARARAPVTN